MTTPAPNRTRFAPRLHSRVAYDPGTIATSNGDAQTVVLLHDLLADRSAWTALRNTLSHHYRIVVPDARGHGASPTLTNQWYTVAELAADVLAVLDAERLSSVHVIGHGLGGTTALELALHSPDRVTTLTLIDPSIQMFANDSQDLIARNDFEQRRTNDRTAADAAYKQLFDRALDTYWLPRYGVDWRQSFTKPQVSAIRRHAPALAALLPALDAYKAEVAEIRALTCPSLIVVSDAASYLDKVSTKRLSEFFSHATMETWSGTDLASDQDGDLVGLICGFIDTSSR